MANSYGAARPGTDRLSYPYMPTMAEAGLPDFEVSSWNGVVAPAKTPPEIVAKLNREPVRILATQDLKDRFAAQAAEPA